MSPLSPLSPLTLPWATLKLVARFGLPLALWYTLGELLRFLLIYGGYRLGLTRIGAPVAPILTLSLLVMVTLSVSVAMMHSVREGLAAVQEREDDGDLAPWAVGNDESMMDALSRALLPFMIFYLAWGWVTEDARAFASAAASRGLVDGGIEGQSRGMGLLITLNRHLYIAIALTVAFFVLKYVCERYVAAKAPRTGSLLTAFCEVNWALFGLFTIDQLRNKAGGWITDRQAWGWLRQVAGHGIDLWPEFKFAVLGSLVWLVIAGVILGVDAEDEEAALGRGRAAQRLVRVSGIDRRHTPLEVMTRELREKWLPTWFGMRLVRRAGFLTFALFCVLFMGLDVAKDLTLREVYVLLGPHPIGWWLPRLTVSGLLVGMVFEALRICLLAAAFNLVVARVSARNAAREPEPGPSRTPPRAGLRAQPM
jgi:hypothetical protein